MSNFGSLDNGISGNDQIGDFEHKYQILFSENIARTASLKTMITFIYVVLFIMLQCIHIAKSNA